MLSSTRLLLAALSASQLFFLGDINKVIAAESSNLQLELQSTFNYRDSESYAFPVSFPFPPEALPVGQESAFLETVDAGKHLEVSNISLKGAWKITPNWRLLFKIDAIDLYDRNPTSQDQKVDADTFLLRYGKKSSAKRPAKTFNYYLQLGKFGKMERQNDRHLQSYGLVSSAFNRFEDAGVELGIDLTPQLYLKTSYTTGNPVFIRDPNALAGDNGTRDRQLPPNNPDPELKSGIVILYDAEIEHFNLNKNPEIGFGIGFRPQTQDKRWQSDIFAWFYQRELAEERELNGTFYGADLDLLDGAVGFGLPTSGDKKKEFGLNYWLYRDSFTLFAQYVDQTLAGLKRTGKELELAYKISLPFNWTFNGKPVIKSITPALRYSDLNTDFSGGGGFPAPSASWDWRKIDAGFNIEFQHRTTLTIEYNKNDFETILGTGHSDEFLTSLNWRYRW